MAAKLGPKIINDQLVLSLDAADANSYAGEPVANLVTSSAVDFSVRTTYSGNTFSQVADSESPSGYACEMSYTGTVNSSSRSRFGAATNIPTSGTGFVSIWVKHSVGPSTTMRPAIFTGTYWYILDPLDGGSSYLTEEYRPFGKAVSFGTASGGPNPGFSMTNGGGSTASDKTRWIKPQVTTLSYNVPFSNLTRPNQIDFISHGDVGSGTTFTDSSVNNLTLTSANGASHAGAGPFGGSAMSFVRASSQQITSPSNSLCDFGTGDFTIDFWFNMNSGTATNTRMHALNIGSGTSTNVSFDFNDSGYGIWLYWMSGGGNYIRQSGNYRNDGLWHHCAFVRDNGTCRLWIDGAYIGGVSYATQIGATQSLYIGSAGGQYWDGYIDEVRIIKGTALWKGASDFSVPTSRGKNASLLDASSNNNNGSLINGTGTSTTHYRDGQVIMPLANAYLEFDGTDNYVSTSFGDDHNPATNPISYTVWVKTHTNSGNKMFLVQSDWGGNHRAYFGTISGVCGMGIQSSGWGSTQGGDTITTNTWNHMCMVFEGLTCKWYRNGSLMFSKSYTSFAFNQNLSIGSARPYSTSYDWDGEIAQVLVHNKALTAAEVLSNYNTTKSRFS
ncbi:LamG domain-containing protein [bacterium]|nr:LamG domain-containing protein [bacterium]MDC0317974.1 LamG domain-containing protein [bacterium]